MEMEEAMKKIIVALDVDSLDKAKPILECLVPLGVSFKVGLNLITSVGTPQAVSFVRSFSEQVILDGKFCDTPKTMGHAARTAARLGVKAFTIHASSGKESIETAVAKKGGKIMNEQEVLRILSKVGAVITDSHIVYTSGKHGATYVNKDAVYSHTKETSDLCRTIAQQFVDDKVDVVIAPTIGGVVLSQWTAHHLSEMTGREVLSVYADKSERIGSALWYIFFGLRLLWKRIPQIGRAPEAYFVIKRGYNKIVAWKNVLVVEDVLTTGNSAKKIIEAARNLGCNVLGLGVLCNRGGITPQDVADVPKLFALVNIKFGEWDEAECPLCAQGVPINTDIGKGWEYLACKNKKTS